MKKKLLALALVMAMLLSCMLMLTSCPDSGDDGPNNGGSQVDGELNLDEGVNGSQGSSDLTIITDPNNPEAGKGSDGNYIG